MTALTRLLERYDQRVPRYTSYPTAPHFDPAVGATAYVERLGRLDPAMPVSLYLHVPYCRQLCWYCGCSTKIVSRYGPVEAFRGLVAQEIELVGREVGKRLRATHVHWGGGTPTILAAGDFLSLMERVRRTFDVTNDAEIAVEVDPRTLSREMVAALAEAGVTRVSLGVQDFDEDEQRAVNRLQPYDLVAQGVAMLRNAGISAINLDLMYGLPRQTAAGVGRSAAMAAALSPQRFAVFGYAHVPWMKRHQQRIDSAALPGVHERWEQAAAIAVVLEGNGYLPVGLDHFALPGDPLEVAARKGRLRRNFQGYTTDDAPVLLGFGPSAISAFADATLQNTADIHAWRTAIAEGHLASHRGILLDDEDRLRRDVIERIMCDDGIDLAAIAAAHTRPADHFTGELRLLESLAADGLVEAAASPLRLTPLGRRLRRAVAAVFDTYLEPSEQRHASAI